MHTTLGLRIARVHSPFLRHVHRPAVTLAPLLSARAKATSASASHTNPRRAASTASQAKSQPPQSASELVSSSSRLTSPLPISATLNPPASTRPPPLELPTRDPESSLFGHLFRLGKAYTTFYKTGLYAILTNRRLLSSSTATSPSSLSSTNTNTFPSRADVLLRERVRHDLSRLPIFGILVLICGEFTPLIVLVFPRLTPYTCRIPKQTAALRRSTTARREASFRALRAGSPDAAGLERLAAGHVCRSLGLTSALWDMIGLDSPFAGALARRAVARIAADDAMIRGGGGLGAVVDEEVVLACEDRGIDVRDQPVDRLRSQLQEWLRKTAPEGKVEGDAVAMTAAWKEAQEKVKAMLLEP